MKSPTNENNFFICEHNIICNRDIRKDEYNIKCCENKKQLRHVFNQYLKHYNYNFIEREYMNYYDEFINKCRGQIYYLNKMIDNINEMKKSADFMPSYSNDYDKEIGPDYDHIDFFQMALNREYLKYKELPELNLNLKYQQYPKLKNLINK